MAPDPRGEAVLGASGQLGKYRLIGQLGRGGMADVFLAVTSGPGGFNKLHVLKLLRQEAFDNSDAVLMFTNEARLAALLNHPNLVQTYEVGEEQGTVFIVMEYLEGQSLHSVLRRAQHASAGGGLDLAMRLRIVADALNGLHYAHELRDLAGTPLNLVHRDVSPQNIIITYDGCIKLVDFGIAKTSITSSATQAGTIKGKVGYMAPEQVNNPGQMSRSTDVFQAGLILWEGIVGRRAWEGLTDYEIVLNLANNVAPPSNVPPDTDPELLRICQKSIAMVPKDRYATAEEFAADLEAFMHSRGIRAAAKDVGAFVARLFAARRQELRDAVQRQLHQIQTGTLNPSLRVGDALPLLLSGVPGTHSGSTSSELLGSVVSSSSQWSRSGITNAPVESKRMDSSRSRRWKLAVAAAAVGTVAVVFAFAARQSGRSTTAPAAAVSNANEGRGAQVVFSIACSPANARITLDNAVLPSNPYRSRVRKEGVVHVVRAEAAGYESASVLVPFDRDTENVMALSPLPARADPVPRAASSTPGEPKAPPARRGSVAARAKPAAPTATNGKSNQEPSAPVKTAPAVKLDQSDPWQ